MESVRAGPALVAVVVTCHNLGEYLHESIASVLQQRLQPVRVILVDDGSNDPFTVFLLDLMPWEGVELIRQDKHGAAAARNVAIRAASTPYVCCLDAGDRLRPEYLAKAVEALATNRELGFVTCYYRLLDCDEGTHGSPACRLPDMLVRNEAVAASVFRREAWRMVGGYCEALGDMHDWDLWIGILEARYGAAVIPEALFEYRKRPQSMFSVTSRPENYSRAAEMIVNRHAATFSQHVSEIIPLYVRQSSDLLNNYRGQIVERDRAAARLRAELMREKRTSNERHEWIKALQEAKGYFLQQLAAAEQGGKDDVQAAAVVNPVGDLAAETEYLCRINREPEQQLAELRGWSRELQEAAGYDEQRAAVAVARVADLAAEVTRVREINRKSEQT
jgi:glycosyltransferase involved in cell wall biosynthesis